MVAHAMAAHEDALAAGLAVSLEGHRCEETDVMAMVAGKGGLPGSILCNLVAVPSPLTLH